MIFETMIMSATIKQDTAPEIVLNEIIDHPGTYLRKISRETGLHRNTVHRELADLKKSRKVESIKEGNRMRYYPANHNFAEQRSMLHPTTERILDYVNAHPRATQAEIAEELDIAIGTVNKHIRKFKKPRK